jgi:hypothetical protein
MPIATRIAEAIQQRRCFACAHYSGPYSLLAGKCRTGGLDPAATAKAGANRLAREACEMVCARNGCDRFELAVAA